MRIYQTVIQLPRFFQYNIGQCKRTICQSNTIYSNINFTDAGGGSCGGGNRNSSLINGNAVSNHNYANQQQQIRKSNLLQKRNIWYSTSCRTTDKHNADEITPSLSQYQAYDMIHKLTEQERESLKNALNQYESDIVRSKFQGELAATKWRLRFGRRDKLPALGHVDPTGSYCAMPDDWLQKKLAEAAVQPTRDELMQTLIVNAIPFVGFGFLDNFFMIIAGDYIEANLGALMCLSTMAAAGLGNTISDVLGLGLAHYVERFCELLGLKAPKLTPAQMQMTSSRRYASIGRALGIVVGCLLGMFPLYFMKKKPSVKVNEDVKPVDAKP